MRPYFFGIYHWRRRFRRLLVGIGAVLLGGLLWRPRRRLWNLAGVVLAVAGLRHATPAIRRLVDPPPWRVQRHKYDRLAATLPLADAETLLDVGSGTGRSLVALAPALASDVTATAVDVFDDRVILGNGPALALKNAQRADLHPHVVRGDASRLPVADGSQDVVTISRVLHDLPDEVAADGALAEIHRVLTTDGALGILEVPVTHSASEDPCSYWRDRVESAGFDVTSARWVDGYVVLRASPV